MIKISERVLKVILYIGLITIGISTLLFVLQFTEVLKYFFGSNFIIFSKAPSEWGIFGDFFGGIANPLLSFLAIMFVILSLNKQEQQKIEDEKEKKKDDLRKEILEILPVIETDINDLAKAILPYDMSKKTYLEYYGSLLPSQQLLFARGTLSLNYLIRATYKYSSEFDEKEFSKMIIGRHIPTINKLIEGKELKEYHSELMYLATTGWKSSNSG